MSLPPLPGAGTFGTVRAGIYRPKSGEPEVKCAIKCLKPTDELPNQKVSPVRGTDVVVTLPPFLSRSFLLSRSLPPSLSLSIPSSLDPSFLSRSLPPSLLLSIPPFLSRSLLPLSIPPSSLDPSSLPLLPHSLPPLLPPLPPLPSIPQSEILREADAMAGLDHPNIVRLYGQ